MTDQTKTTIAGGLAGAINGIFGAGGGLVLVPLLALGSRKDPENVFPTSVSILFPICIVSLIIRLQQNGAPLHLAWPYMVGAIFGGAIAAKFGSRIPAAWLHRILGVMILWGGIRNLC